jgi:hypothetical protein
MSFGPKEHENKRSYEEAIEALVRIRTQEIRMRAEGKQVGDSSNITKFIASLYNMYVWEVAQDEYDKTNEAFAQGSQAP